MREERKTSELSRSSEPDFQPPRPAFSPLGVKTSKYQQPTSRFSSSNLLRSKVQSARNSFHQAGLSRGSSAFDDNQSSTSDIAAEVVEIQRHLDHTLAMIAPLGTVESSMESKIINTIKKMGQIHSLPVKHVEGNHYLVGIKIVNCVGETLGTKVLVRVGGGYESLKQHVAANSRLAQRHIGMQMKKHGQTVDQVVDQLVSRQKNKFIVQQSAVAAAAVTSLASTPLDSMPSVPFAKIKGSSSNRQLSASNRSLNLSNQNKTLRSKKTLVLQRSQGAASLGGAASPGVSGGHEEAKE